jgi:hypothetical protein
MIDRFPHGREARASQTRKPTHYVKIGFNKGTIEKARPGCYNGFVIYKAALGTGGQYMPDYELMRILIAANVARSDESASAWRWACREMGIATEAVTYEAVKALIGLAKERERDLPPGVLPQRIEFRLPSSATRSPDGKWAFNGVFDASLSAYKQDGCKGEFCRGDGVTASRWQPDSTRKTIPCIPWGADGAAEKDWCRYSMPKPRLDRDGKPEMRNGYAVVDPPACRPRGTAQVVLGYRVDVEVDGRYHAKLQPLSRMADALFEVETTSADAIMHFQSTLLYAADQLDGRIAGLSGTLSYAEVGRMTPHHVGGQVRETQQINLTLSDWEIEQRRAQRAGEIALDYSQPLLLTAAPVAPAPVVVAKQEDAEPPLPVDAEDHIPEADGELEPERPPALPPVDIEADHALAVSLWTGAQRVALKQRPAGTPEERETIAREILSTCLAKQDGTPGPNTIEPVLSSLSTPDRVSPHHAAAMQRIDRGLEILAEIEGDVDAAMTAQPEPTSTENSNETGNHG